MAKPQGTWNTVEKRLHAVNEKLQDLQGRTTDYIAENPLKSAIIAFGIGALAGAIIMKLLDKK